MSTFAKVAAAALAPMVFAGTASAGDYHTGLTLRCADCHIMHYSRQHGYNPDGSGITLGLGSSGPYEFLLRDTINNLCLSCHDQNGLAPDVLGAANGGNGPTDIREAGFLNRLGIEGLAPTGHTLDTTDTAPGSDPAWSNADGLNCIDCHHQHAYAGNGHPTGSQYRNLKYNPGSGGGGKWVTYNGTPGNQDLSRDVFIRNDLEYDEGDVDFNEPDNTQSAIGKWCAGCHSDFHGIPGGPEIGGVPGTNGYAEFHRHPAAGANIGALGGGHSRLSQFFDRTNKVKVMSESGVWDGTVGDVTPTCISCHKAHGNGNAFGLILRSGGGDPTENGDTGAGPPGSAMLEHLCGQCHGQASAFAQ